jgi:type III secretion protein L
MALWLKSGDLEVGVSDGIVRADEFAALVHTHELSQRAQKRLAEAEARGDQIVAQALHEAEALVRQAREDAEHIRAEAHQQGLREAAQAWAQQVAERAYDAQKSNQRAAERLAELVSLATQRVIEVEDKEGLYRRALRSVRTLAADSKSLTLHIASEDAEHARHVVRQLAEELGIPVPLEVKVDSRLRTGGCVLESDQGVIDASMGLQIQAVRQAIARAARAALARPQEA